MNTKEAILLAGGFGTRMQGILPDIPKCMAPVQGRPFLTYVLDYLITQEIDKVILSVGYRKGQIISYFGNSYYSLHIEYAGENTPLGTGGAIKSAFNLCKQDEAFVINGDTYFRPDLSAMEKLHILSAADATLALKYMNYTERYGLVETDSKGRITDFKEKEIGSAGGWINGGIYLIERKIFNDIKEDEFSIEKDVFKLSHSIFRLQTFKSDAFFLDMGIPADFEKAQSILKSQGEV